MTDTERNEKTNSIIQKYKCEHKTIKVIGSTGNIYKVTAIRKKKKIVDVVCNCKGYFYRESCWHTTKYSKSNQYWLKNNLKWKK